jgi:hypothetical protein
VKIKAATFADKLDARLQSIGESIELADFLIKYDLFNRAFPGGALVLAGRASYATDILGNEGAERVGGAILAGIVDEYIDRSSWLVKTHCTMRRELTATTIKFLTGRTDLKEIITKNYSSYLASIMESGSAGYCITERVSTDHDLYEGLGFFLASETSGSSEFTVLHNYLQAAQPELVAELRKQKVEGRVVYSWVEDHTTLEVDHALCAQEAVRTAVTNTQEDKQLWAIKEILEGAEYFFDFADKVLIQTPILLKI